jgi:hypothetical protein
LAPPVTFVSVPAADPEHIVLVPPMEPAVGNGVTVTATAAVFTVMLQPVVLRL